MDRFELIAGSFVRILLNPEFQFQSSEPYRSIRTGRKGVRWIGQLNGWLFRVSESRTTVPSTPQQLATILSNSDSLDRTKEPVYYAHKRFGQGVRIEARHSGRWFHIFTPISYDQFLTFVGN
jgi:hypothetical protein